ncbi:MAG: DUF362 domain-containing protein [Bacteroidetes bacterium]|nr:DUF362 domain-containing protein [Bacteroidota bacterium]
MKRRDFLFSTIAAGAAVSLMHQVRAHPLRNSIRGSAGRPAAQALRLHPFLAAHPDAVFIRRTQVTSKLDTMAKQSEGEALTAELFSADASGDIPFTNAMAIKPNLTCTFGTGNTAEGMGIMTDLPFVEGMVAGLSQHGFPAHNMYMREGNWLGDGYCASEYPVTGVLVDQLAQRQGIHAFDFPTGRHLNDMTLESLQAGTEVIWRDVHGDGVVFKRIGYLAPYNDDDSFLLNVAKFKAHGMGMTLTAKNLQGMCVAPYIHFCEGLTSLANRPAHVLADFHADREQRINALYARHVAEGIPRWDRPEPGGGYGMEVWAQRTCDALSVVGPGLHVIEGIYGRNGDGFNGGPGPGNTPEEFMSNLLIFGRNPLLVDVIGTWLAGHEPGNFGLFHIARERGLCPTFVPDAIPLYDWNGGEPVSATLTEQPRTPILCPYLRRDYDGQHEDQYHLVDEPFDYSTVSVDRLEALPVKAEIIALQNPVRDVALFELRFPKETHARVEIYDGMGRRIAVLRDERFNDGSYSVRWTPGRVPAGMYIARLLTPAASVSTRIVLLR